MSYCIYLFMSRKRHWSVEKKTKKKKHAKREREIQTFTYFVPEDYHFTLSRLSQNYIALIQILESYFLWVELL